MPDEADTEKPQNAAFLIFGAPGAIIRPIPGAHPCGARLRRFKIVPDNFVERGALCARVLTPNQTTQNKAGPLNSGPA
jgi:hypothetical protein